MAKAQQAQQEQQAHSEAIAPTEAPSGFAIGGTPDIDGWYNPEPGVAFQGQIMGMIEMADRRSDESRTAFLIKLDFPIAAKERGGSTVQLSAGSILGVGMRYQLKEMVLYVEHHGHVWCKAKGKKKLASGDMWEFDIAFRGKKAPLIRQPTMPTTHTDDSLPF